jgi:hypothetical protein
MAQPSDKLKRETDAALLLSYDYVTPSCGRSGRSFDWQLSALSFSESITDQA